MQNSTEVNEFTVVGLTDAPELQVILFITLVGNVGIIVLIYLDPPLHTPTYFFLSNLSLVDCVYSSNITPKMMAGLLTGNKVISHDSCAAQMFFFVAFASVDFFLLAVMVYEHNAGICKPLHYTTSMRANLCTQLVTDCYIWGIIESSIHIGFTFHFSFWGSNIVHHFFCEIPLILVLSCSYIHINEVILFVLTVFNVIFALLIILISYLFIFITFLRMHSAEGPQKAFSSDTSHLTAASIFYETVIFMYLQPNSSHSMDNDQMGSVFYTIVIPMLNPLLYSLRNKEVNKAFRK
uniref:G-protein coupled receptors family 1 profile domain-containing protein n=2 Tax=Vombatus ursinus TaxID=29139 RepID=A0A4X2JUT7_VOMUR